MFSFNVLQMF